MLQSRSHGLQPVPVSAEQAAGDRMAALLPSSGSSIEMRLLAEVFSTRFRLNIESWNRKLEASGAPFRALRS